MIIHEIKKIESKIIDNWYIIPIQFTFFFVLTFVLFRSYISNNLIAMNGDGCGYLNIEYYARECLKHGDFPLWNAYMSAGRPFINDISNFVFYPVRIVFSILPTLYFFYAFYSFHLAFGAVSFSLYLKEIGCEKKISLAMSLPYYFSICLGGYRKSHLLIIACIVYLPMILFLIEKYFNTNQPKFLWISSLFFAIQFLTGYPQDAFYTDIIAGIYFIVLEFKHKFSIYRWIRDGICWVLFYIGMVLIQLVPFAELYGTYSANGSAEMTLEQFRTYSINPIKLLLMVCPTLFSEHPNNALMQIGYSEIQAEIFMGTVSAILIILAIWKYRNDYRVKVSLCFMAAIFVFAMNGEFAFLSIIIYHIPILGSFRCASRILFAFTFFGLVVIACMLEKVMDASEYKYLLLLFEVAFGLLALLMIANVAVMFINNTNQNISLTEIFGRYNKTIVIVFLAIIAIHFSQLLGVYKKYFIVISMICLIILDVYPYWKESSTYDMTEFGVNNDIESFLVEHQNEGKVILDSPYIDGNYKSALATSFALSLKVQGINSYTTFNDPRLSMLFTDESIVEPSFNFSGLYTGFPEISENFLYDNDMLSMLGIKYIIDQEGLVPENEHCFGRVLDKNEISFNQDLIIIDSNQGLSVIGYPINVQSDSFYLVSFSYDGEDDPCEYFYIDFYADNYDNIEQERSIKLSKAKKHYEYIIPSGNIEQAYGQIYIRIVANNNKDIVIRDFTVEQVDYEKIDNPYELVFESGNVKIYKNNNCKELLYIPESVQKINDISDLYRNKSRYDLDNVSYIEGSENFNPSNALIDKVSQNTNRVSALIHAEDKTFVNFSQASYPGWEAFVDGEKTSIYEVNGYIQGIELDKGDHFIEFIYRPKSVLYGIIGSIMTFCIWLYSIKKRHSQEVKNNA